MANLSPDTVKLIDRLFPHEQRAEVADILARECGDNLPLTGPPGGSHERIRFAVLKVSNGDVTKLRDAVDHAKIDWRDVLMWAGFGESLSAHQEWARAVLHPPAP
jgi:hypothetical protein